MNERIKELAKQAEEYACLHEEHWHPGPDWDELFREKFAELIVRECMEQVRDEVQYGCDWVLADAVTKRVLEHFGVEE